MDAKVASRIVSLYKMIIVDDDISILEVQEFQRIAKEHYGIDESEITNLIFSPVELIPNFDDDNDKILFLYELTLIATADGILQDSEKDYLKSNIEKLGFSIESADEIVEFLIEKAKAKTPFQKVIDEINA